MKSSCAQLSRINKGAKERPGYKSNPRFFAEKRGLSSPFSKGFRLTVKRMWVLFLELSIDIIGNFLELILREFDFLDHINVGFLVEPNNKVL